MAVVGASDKRLCSLLLFVATSSEEEALEEAAVKRNCQFERIRDKTLGGSAAAGRTLATTRNTLL